MAGKRKIVLIELNDYHTESMYSQVLFLESAGYEVHILCSQGALKQLHFMPASVQTQGYSFEYGFFKGLFRNTASLLRIGRYIRRNQIQRVVFHTAHGKRVWQLLLLLRNKRRTFYGVLHSTENLGSVVHKRIAGLLDHCFVLNDHLLRSLPFPFVPTTSFYAVWFPHHGEANAKPDGDAFTICIPGRVHFQRRDYDGLLRQLCASRGRIPQRLKFVILGDGSTPSGRKFRELVQQAGLADSFVFFDSFISNAGFDQWLLGSDLLMPLIHPLENRQSEYLKHKISGSFNLSIAFRIPMLLDGQLQVYEDFRTISIYYNPSNMIEVITDIMDDPQRISGMKQRMQQDPRWRFEYQQRKYLAAIEDPSISDIPAKG